MLAWLSVWSEVQTCILLSWCHCHSLSLAAVKSRFVLPLWHQPIQVVPPGKRTVKRVWVSWLDTNLPPTQWFLANTYQVPAVPTELGQCRQLPLTTHRSLLITPPIVKQHQPAPIPSPYPATSSWPCRTDLQWRPTIFILPTLSLCPYKHHRRANNSKVK